jgi:beta-phosphoglucomutase-like phosphatase (HAD superfamily)
LVCRRRPSPEECLQREIRNARHFGLLFDLDGTLVDSDALHLRAFAEVLRGAGVVVVVDEASYRSNIAGRSNDLIIAGAYPDASQMQRVEIAARKEALYRASLIAIRIVSGAADLIQWARSQNIRCAVVTTSPRTSAKAVLNGVNLLSSFDLLVVGDEVQRGKPDPLPYSTAC